MTAVLDAAPVSLEARLRALVGKYWHIAYQEGAEGRTHDTADGIAASTWASIEACIDELATLRATLAQPGAVVGRAMVVRALDCRPFDAESNGRRAWQFLPMEKHDAEAFMRAVLLAALQQPSEVSP